MSVKVRPDIFAGRMLKGERRHVDRLRMNLRIQKRVPFIVIVGASFMCLIAGVSVAIAASNKLTGVSRQWIEDSTTDGPTFPALSANAEPSISGMIAFTTFSLPDGKGTACVHVVEAATGNDKTFTCFSDQDPPSEAWTTDGNLVVAHTDSFSGDTSTVELFDPHSGSSLAKQETHIRDVSVWGADVPYHQTRLGQELQTNTNYLCGGDKLCSASSPRYSRDGSVATVSDGDVKISIPAPGAYRFYSGLRSPDQNWVAVVDSQNRILVSDNSGANIRVLTEQHYVSSSAAYQSLEWFQPNHPELATSFDVYSQSNSPL